MVFLRYLTRPTNLTALYPGCAYSTYRHNDIADLISRFQCQRVLAIGPGYAEQPLSTLQNGADLPIISFFITQRDQLCRFVYYNIIP